MRLLLSTVTVDHVFCLCIFTTILLIYSNQFNIDLSFFCLISRTHLAVTKHFNAHARVWAQGCNNARGGVECVVQPNAHTSAPTH